jgi:hypothetical protein
VVIAPASREQAHEFALAQGVRRDVDGDSWIGDAIVSAR